MPGDTQARTGRLAFQAFGDAVELLAVGGVHLRRIEGEVQVAHDNGFFLDDRRRRRDFLDRLRRRRRDLFAGTVHPAIGGTDATADQGAPAGPAAAFDRAQAGAGNTTDRRTGRPVAFLQPCATGQQAADQNQG